MEIRECGAGDVAHLERWKPSGLTQVHALRFQRQERGLGTFLIAWLNGSPAASAEIRWDGCAAVEVQRAFPDCPEINGLQVWPAEIRSQGVGTSLTTEAEIRARQRGYGWLGLGVDDHNDRAAALYLRLGYAETDCRYLDRYYYVSQDGGRHDVADPCRFLIKSL
ncbi:GNAT family N-acetyltransferase [Amycolatopsis sp.]|uniref:GNAT family N-acetyltransferase n=1 Tax=Amycolatopsis sp. TaxID=37632 RepID=UPI002DF8C08C|nr:GNAT family N-acetyltransferase [Amycolatopsis sp.]